MIAIKVYDRDSQLHEVEVPTDRPLMWTLRDAGLPIEALCGGCASCGTCHVYVDAASVEKLPPIEPMEREMLEVLSHYREGSSRLSCQVTPVERMDGAVLHMAPDE